MTRQSPHRSELALLHTRFYPDRHGGVEQHLWRFADVARQRVAVTVLTENRLGLADTDELSPGLMVRRARPLDAGRMWRWPYLLRLRWWMKLLREHKPRGWVWTVDPPGAAAAIASGYGSRTVFNPPGCWAAMHQVYRARPHVTTMKIDPVFRTMERFAYRRAGRVVTASRAIVQQYERFIGARDGVTVVPRAADDALSDQLPSRSNARASLGLAEAGFVVGFVGRLDPCKDLPHLIEACSGPGVLGTDDRLLIVGEGPDRQRTEKCLKRHDLRRHAVFAGRLTGAHLHAAYAAMDAFVLPSVYEGYGMVILEAMAAGVPVIGRPANDRSVFTSMAEMIEPNVTGLLMHPRDVGDLAEKLVWVKLHPREAGAMARTAQRRIATRSWTDVVYSYLDVMDMGVASAPALARAA